MSEREHRMWWWGPERQHTESCKLQMNQTLGSLKTLQLWLSLAPAGVMWWICQLEALLHSSASQVEVCSRLLLVCLLCVVLAVSLRALRHRLGPRQSQETKSKQHQGAVHLSRNNHNVWMAENRIPDLQVPVSVALADSVLLCVLQEPLQDPSVANIEALLSRLEAVSQSLEKIGLGSEAKPENGCGALSNIVKLTSDYLRDRNRILHALIQVQAGFEASVEDMLQGLDGFWKQLEELHAGVTLSKREGQGHKDLASAQTEAETLFAVLNHYREKLGSCEVQLKESTQLLQELTWSHTHTCNKVNSSSESVWPELLLQVNMEQFDKVQESFTCLEQQTSTFQAHLEGLGKGHQELLSAAGPNAETRQDSDESPERSDAAGSGKSSSLLLCGKSSRHLSSRFGRLRKISKNK